MGSILEAWPACDEEEALPIKTYLQQMAEMRRSMNERTNTCQDFAYSSVEEFVLKHGRAWEPQELPKDFDWDEPKMCFRNAASLALECPALTYVEGFATSIIPVDHAWCVDEKGRVIDTTWKPSDIRRPAYYGVPFPTDFLREQLLRRKVWGILQNWEQGYPLLRVEYNAEEIWKKFN